MVSHQPTSPPANSSKQLELVSRRGVFAKRPGKALPTAYSQDARGDCRPSYERGTGNFTISQASRFPPEKKPLGGDGDYNPGASETIGMRTAPQKKASSAFRDKASSFTEVGEKSAPGPGM